MERIVEKQNSFKHLPEINKFLPSPAPDLSQPVEDISLYSEQVVLSDILETAGSYEEATQLLRSSILANSRWETEKWAPFMLETAIAIAQKWKHGFA